MAELPATGSVRVGRYALEVGPQTGSFAQFQPEREREHARAVGEALEEKPEEGLTPVVEALEEVEDTADAVTDRIEHADRLFRAAVEGRLLERDLLIGEVDKLLGLLQRLDKSGRFDEELRLARALHGLLVLAFRWLELVRSLRMVLAAARRAGDGAGQAWALNELGALHLCAGDAKRAVEHLEEALALEERIGDAASRCAARHNLDCARRDLARNALLWRRRLAVAAGALVLFAAGAALGLALAGEDDVVVVPTEETTTTDGGTTTTETTTETPPQEFALTVVVTGSGTVDSTDGTIACGPTCTAPFVDGTEVPLTATAEGWVVEWQDVECAEGEQTLDVCTVTVTGETTVTAVFQPLVTVSVTPDGTSGVVTIEPPGIRCPEECSFAVPVNTPVTFTAVEETAVWELREWQGVTCEEEEEQTLDTCTFVVTGPVVAVADFAQPPD